MSDLPPGWEWTTLGEIARIDSNLVDPVDHPDEPHIAPNHIESRTGRLLPHRTVREDGVTSPKHRFSVEHVLYSKIRPYLAKATLPTSAGLCSADMYPISASIDRRFLLRWLISPEFTALVAPHQGRSLLPKINSKALLGLPVPVAPLAEQRRIVDAIDGHLSTIDSADQTVSACKTRCLTLREALVRDILYPPELVSPAPPPAAAFTTEGDLPAVPNSWSWRRLGEVAEVVGGIPKDSSKQSDPAVSLVSYLRVANVQRGRLELSNVAQIRAAPRQIEKLRLQHGDVLLNEGGDRDKLGRGWVWENQVENCIHQNHVFRARVRDDLLHPKLLAWHANSFGPWFERNGKQSVNLASISLTTIKALPVPVPPRDVQDAMVSEIDHVIASCQQLHDVAASTSARAETLRSALLREAFAGGLTHQDPSDEPASVLLERIRAERAAAPPAKAVRRRARRGPAL